MLTPQIFDLLVISIISTAVVIGVSIYFFWVHRLFSRLRDALEGAINETIETRENINKNVNSVMGTIIDNPFFNIDEMSRIIQNAVQEATYEIERPRQWRSLSRASSSQSDKSQTRNDANSEDANRQTSGRKLDF